MNDQYARECRKADDERVGVALVTGTVVMDCAEDILGVDDMMREETCERRRGREERNDNSKEGRTHARRHAGTHDRRVQGGMQPAVEHRYTAV